MGGRLQAADRDRTQLPVDRLRRRHQNDQAEDGHLRRHRHAAQARGAQGGGPRPVSDDHRRGGAGGEHQGRVGRPAHSRRGDRGRHLSRRNRHVERPAHQEAEPQALAPRHHDRPIYRSDGSGTNFLFSDYLSKTSPKFKEKVGANTSVQWPVGIGAKGNEGVANMTRQTDGALGYVEYAYAKQTNMPYANLINKAGKAVSPNAESFQAAAANADWAHAAGYYLILTDQAGEKSWPITGASFILVYATPPDPTATGEALKFFNWAYDKGARMASELDYVPLPPSLIKQVRATWQGETKGAPGLASAPAGKRM